MQARSTLRRSGIALLLGALGAALVLLNSGAGGAAGTKVGAASPRGCIDDNDTATDPIQGEDDCAQSTNGLAGVTSLVISSDGKSVYAASEAEDAITRFKRSRKSGKLKPRGCVDDNDTATDPFQGEDDCAQSTNGLGGVTSLALSRDGKSLYAVSEHDDAIVRFKRSRKTGKLKPRGCIDDNDFATDPGQGEDTCAQSANGLSQLGTIVISSDGKSVYAGSEGDIALARFKRDTRTGKLSPRGCSIDSDSTALENCARTVVNMNKPDGLALSPDDRSLYVSASTDSTVVRFKRSRNSGKITAKGCIGDHDTPLPGCARNTHGLAENSGLTVSADGRSLYVASESDDSMAIFARSRKSGKLRPRGCIDDNDFATDPGQGEDSCARSTNGMAKTTDVVVSPDGKSIYTTAEVDDAIVRFKRAR